MDRRTRAFPIVISGPSGVGKTTLEARVVAADPWIRPSVSTTTRAPREGEVAGRDYFFVTRAVFEAMKDRELLEWAEVHGEYYGTPRRFVEDELASGHDVLLNIDVQGGLNVKKRFPEAVTIFIFPPSFEALEARIRGRDGGAAATIETRLRNAREEFRAAVRYDYFVVNDDVDEAVAAILAIVAAERCRRDRHGEGFVAAFAAPEGG